MTSRLRPASILAAALGLTASAFAQFDTTWVRFAPDTNRIRDTSGNPATAITGPVGSEHFAWGDLDHDGWTDLVIVTNAQTIQNRLLMNEAGILVDRTAQFATDSDVPGDGGFLAATFDLDVVLADVDQDGWLDVVTSTYGYPVGGPQSLTHPRVYVNKRRDPAGNWLGLRYESVRIPVLFPPTQSGWYQGVAAADVTGDGYPDLYFSGYPLDKLLINDGTGTFVDSGTTRMTQPMLADPAPITARIVDMNGDGVRDIVRSITWSDAPFQHVQTVSIAYNDPANVGFFPAALYQFDVSGGGTNYADVGDLNNDGRPDLALSRDGLDAYRFNTGLDAQGRATWGPLQYYTYVADVDGFSGGNLIVDVDGDGWRDVLQADVDITAASCTQNRCHIHHNLGGPPGTQVPLKEEAGLATGAWRGAVGFLGSDLSGMFEPAAFDIDNDGDVDLVFARCAGTFVWINLGPDPVITSSCFGDGTGTACPCGSVGNPGRGCPNSQFPGGGLLAGSGRAGVLIDTFVLTSTDITNSPGLYFQGTGVFAGGAGTTFGDGLLCASGQYARLGIVFASSNTSMLPNAAATTPIHVLGLALPGDLRHYQLWHRDSVASFCPPEGFNLTNAVSVTWGH